MPPAILTVLLCLLVSCQASDPAKLTRQWSQANPHWRGVHLWLDNETSARELVQTLPALAAAGANVVLVEVNYSYEFTGHPELRNRDYVTRATAHELARTARACGIRLIPEFNCLGHQSFGGHRAPLLRVHPDFNETPDRHLHDPGMYCFSWCPRAPGLPEIIFSLIDDLADGFEADAFHVGMDEVYLLGEADCPRCHGADPAELFALEVNRLHDHLQHRHLTMLMWADRVEGAKYQGVSQYDNAHNDLSAAIEKIPRDIILCDWHYEGRRHYPSLGYLTGKGFRVLACGFTPEKAAAAFSDDARRQNNPLILGYVATTWNETSIADSPRWPPIRDLLPRWK